MEVLKEELFNSLCQPNEADKFLPEGKLLQLMNEKHLFQSGLGPEFLSMISDHTRKVLAIWLFANAICDNDISAASIAHEGGLTDKHLPLLSDPPDDDITRMFKSALKLSQFRHNQWLVQAPVFREEHHDIHENCPMPFTEYEHKASGGFCNVYKAKFHPDHLIVRRE